MPRSGGAFFSGPMTPCIHGRGLPEHNRRGPLGRINPQFSPLSPSFFSRATASPSQVSALSGASAVLREICLRATAHGIRRRASCSRKSSSLGPRCVPSTSEAPVDGSANRGLRAPTAQGGDPNFGTHLTIRLRKVSSSSSPQRMPTLIVWMGQGQVDLFRRCLFQCCAPPRPAI